MRITFIIPFASLSGGHRVVATYARILQARGHVVTVVSPAFPAPRKDLRSRMRRLLGRGPRRPVEIDLTFLGSNHRVLESYRPPKAEDLPDADVVIATWWETAEWVARLPNSKGRKAYLLQDYEVFPPMSAERTIATYRLGFRMIAVSNYIKDVIETQHGVRDISVVPNAVDLRQFDAPPRPKNTSIRVGFLYNSIERKNVGLAIDSIVQAQRQIPDLEAVVFGGSLPVTPLPNFVRYVRNPKPEDISKLYAACDLWLFPSKHEGFGLPLLEAMACGTPVVATRAGAAPDLVDGLNGTLVRTEVDEFVSEIVRYAEMKSAEWETRSAAARDKARSYTWDMATDRLLTILKEI